MDLPIPVQGWAKVWFPSSGNMRRKSCVLQPAAGRRTQFFHLIFTEPGNRTLAHPCKPQKAVIKANFLTGVARWAKLLYPRFGEFCYFCCSPLLPKLACNILATWEWLFSPTLCRVWSKKATIFRCSEMEWKFAWSNSIVWHTAAKQPFILKPAGTRIVANPLPSHNGKSVSRWRS